VDPQRAGVAADSGGGPLRAGAQPPDAGAGLRCALRREELCSLRTDDVDPAHRMLRVRAETTKNRLERVVPYSASTGVLLSQYLVHRATVSRSRGPLFLSESRRNRAEPLSLWNLVEGGPPDRPGLRGRAVFDAHDPAPVPDGPGQDGLGGPRDRRVRRAPAYRFHAAVYQPCPAGGSPTSSAGACWPSWPRTPSGSPTAQCSGP